MKLQLPSVVSAVALAAVAGAQTSATGTISLVSSFAGINNYDISLTNTGTTDIQTLWFAWVEAGDLDLLPSDPSAVSSPLGWAELTNGPGTYSIEWITAGALAPGQTLKGFDFSSTDTLADLLGTSQGYPILTSFVYQGQPLQGLSDEFLITPAPEPATLVALGGLAALALVRRRRGLCRN